MNPISIGLGGTGQQLLNSIQTNAGRQNTSVERLSTGKRINRPSDDPPGFVAAEELHQQLDDLKLKLGAIGTERDQNNAQQSALNNIEHVLTDLRDKVLATSDQFIGADEKASLKADVSETIDALNRLAKQSGNDNIAGLGDADIQAILNSDTPSTDAIDGQTQAVRIDQAQLAADNRSQLDTFANLYQDQAVITSGALSRIEDTDFASETAEFAQSRVQLQAAMAALSYASRSQADQIKNLLDQTA
jgi:flagellin-like hook-associated protein FlgL